MKTLSAGMAVWACTISFAGAQTAEPGGPPPLIPSYGTMTGASAEPLAGSVSAIFALYEEPDGGVPLWVDIQAVETDAAGGYLVLLGSATELPVDLFATGQALWLGVQPEGHAELPRVRFTSVPYALKAGDADTLGGRSLAEFVLLSGEDGAGVSDGSAKAADALTTASSDDLVSTADAAGAFASLTISGQSDLLGSVGIGTSSPDGTVHVHTATAGSVTGHAVADDLVLENSTHVGLSLLSPNTTTQRILFGDPESNARGEVSYDHATDALALQTAGVIGMTMDSSQRIGVGTTSPVGTLHTRMATAGAITANAVADDLVLENATHVGLTFLSPNTTTARILFGDPESNARGEVSYDHATDVLALQTAGVIGMTMDSSQNVGIGTASPTAKLHVAGDLIVDGNVGAKYQDVAEWVDAVGAPSPGTVVVADPTGRNRVRAAEAPYDTKVLGAVSHQPGVVLGEPGPGRVLVPQSGRVKVKVDASYGPIAVGDILTTSATPGHARWSAPLTVGEISLHRPGTVLGKALEPLETGRGEISF